MELSQILINQISKIEIFLALQRTKAVELCYGQILKKGEDKYYLELKGKDVYLRVYGEKSENPSSLLEKTSSAIRGTIGRNIPIITNQ